MSVKSELRVGVISDTHGLLRPGVRAFLCGCDYIIHGGDVGDAVILEQLEALAPVIAVKGNNDDEPWAKGLHATELIRLGGVFVYVIHNLSQLDIDPAALGIRAVISGHSHKPRIEERAGIIYLNPGSCGPRRFKLPVAIGELLVAGSNLRARIVELQ